MLALKNGLFRVSRSSSGWMKASLAKCVSFVGCSPWQMIWMPGNNWLRLCMKVYRIISSTFAMSYSRRSSADWPITDVLARLAAAKGPVTLFVVWTRAPACWTMTTQSLIRLLSLTTCLDLIIFLKLFACFAFGLFDCDLFLIIAKVCKTSSLNSISSSELSLNLVKISY